MVRSVVCLFLLLSSCIYAAPAWSCHAHSKISLAVARAVDRSIPYKMVELGGARVRKMFGTGTVDWNWSAPDLPESAKVSLIRNSTFGFALAAGKSKTSGVFEGIKNFNREVAEKRPDFTFLENVNSGAAFAFDQSISIGVIKNSLFGGKNPFSG